MISRPKKNLPPQNLERRLFTVHQAAQVLGVGDGFVRDRIWSGALPFVRCGRLVKIDLLDLEAFIAANKECNALPAMPVTTHGL
jgi:excisionase family DNA binding protein